MSIVDQSTAVTASSTGVVVTSGAGSNTLGGFQELIASTSVETYWYQLAVKSPRVLGSDENIIVELALGAALSEVVFCRFPVFMNVDGVIPLPPMPKTIASGSRISMRIQATAASKTIEVMIFLSDNDEFGTSTEQESIGVDSGTSRGTDVDTGSTDNVKGGYVELSSSISIDANYVVVLLGNSDNNNQSNLAFLYSIANGAALSEVDRIDNALFSSSSVELSSISQGFFQDFSSADRISVNAQTNDATDSNDRIIDVAMILFKMVPPAGGGGGIAQIVGSGGIVG
jgi:hypothetical protein